MIVRPAHRPALIGLAALFPGVHAQAQEVAPGWQQVGAAPAVAYRNLAAAQEVVMLLGPFPRTQSTVEQQAVDTAEQMTASMGCGRYDPATVRLSADRATALLPSQDGGCAVAARFDPAGTARATLINGRLTGASGDVFARALAWAGYAPDAVPTTTPAPPPPPAGDGTDTTLTAALAAVPAEARPQHVVLHGTGSCSGWPATYVYHATTYLLFGNGWATRCADWDPGVLRPTPESLGKAYPGCGLQRWRATCSDGVELQEADGSWSTPTGVRGELRSFRAGETLDIAFGNVGGIGFAGAAGGVSTSMLSGSDLRMMADGRIAVGGWSSVVVSGSNIGGGSNSRSRPIAGLYRLDGNVIAIRDASGAISRGFIAGVPAAGRPEHIYLNGKQFWADD